MKPSATRMQMWLDQFDINIEKGLACKDAGKFFEARRLLAGAAEALYNLAAGADSGKLRDQRIRQADEIMNLVESLPMQSGAPRTASRSGGGGEQSDGAAEFLKADLPENGPGFDDIAGLDEVKEQIRLRMIYPFTHPDKAKKHGLRIGGGILMFGPPGTGKTMFAKATAKELGAAFYTVKPSEVMSKWVGEAEQNIRALFKTARSNDRSVVFIDEIESLVPARGENASTVMQRVVPQFLAELEGFDTAGANPILFVGATNEPWSIDPAMLRPGRFDVRVYIGLPDYEARLYIIKKQFSKKPLEPGLTLEDFARKTEGYSGADLRAFSEKAAQEAFKSEMEDGRDVVYTSDLLDECLSQIRPSVNAKQLAKMEKWRAENL